MNSLQNIAISASAGSGKTYTLTNRFIYLLHAFEQPERIIALTFTRTAAGEFFHKIIEKLCDAAEDPSKAASLSKELAITADCARYHHLLKLLIHSMHKLNLQTLDSFFFRVVSSFALELGLSGSLKLLDESSEPRMRNEVRDSIVHRPGELTTELNEFWHAFKQATYGQEARSIEKVVSEFIEQLYALYLDTPDADRWGQAATIWPQGCPWQTSVAPDWEQLANNLLAALPDDLGKAQINDFNSAANAIRNYGGNEKLNTLLNNALAVAPDILAGQADYQSTQRATTEQRTLQRPRRLLTCHHLAPSEARARKHPRRASHFTGLSRQLRPYRAPPRTPRLRRSHPPPRTRLRRLADGRSRSDDAATDGLPARRSI